jgi:hypothetical protein
MPVPTLRMTQPDGSTEVIAPAVAQQVPPTPPPPPSTDESYIVNTLDIEINVENTMLAMSARTPLQHGMFGSSSKA